MLLERRQTRRDRVKAERAEMLAAKQRDGYKCVWPNCRNDLPIDVCHQAHRGMGGNPRGDRTTRKTLVCLCRWHHGLWDRGEIDIITKDRLMFDGPKVFYASNPKHYLKAKR